MSKKISDIGKKRISPEEVKDFSLSIQKIKDEIAKVFLGHKDIIDSLIRALICNGHVLVEGIPGIAKTLAIMSLAKASGCSAKRIQFTVDILPTDIIGLTTYTPNKGFEVVKGPIFVNFLIADEINGGSPKTQSALIEAMQERQVTMGRETYPLPNPFFVMASQNPIETEGVYTLPEAQLDRFLFNIVFSYPDRETEELVMQQNVTFKRFSEYNLKSIVSPKKIIEMQKKVHDVYCDDKIRKYILDIVEMTRKKNFNYGEYVELGCSPRANISIYIASKAEALMNGRNFVIPKDVKKVAMDCLRHRIILTYRAYADKLTADKVIEGILDKVRVD